MRPNPRAPVAKRLCESGNVRLMVSGGGTGGHIMPALALCEAVLKRAPRSVLWYIGRRRSMEERLTKDSALPFKRLHAAPLRRGPVGFIAFIAAMLLGTVEALVLILRFRPHVLVGFGGYASFPLLLAGILLRRTVVVHEANALPGKAVRLLVRLDARLAYGLVPDAGGALGVLVARLGNRACLTGNPLRRSFFEVSQARARVLTGFSGDAPTVLIIGGSQGSRTLNTLAPAAIGLLKQAEPHVRVIHLTGATDSPAVRHAYAGIHVPHFVTAFTDEIGGLYRLATVVVARAGALTVSEICAAGVPAVLVPFPFAAEDHQTANAHVLEQHGGAVVVQETGLDAPRLAAALGSVLTDAGLAAAMAAANTTLAQPDAAEKLVDFIELCLTKQESHPGR